MRTYVATRAELTNSGLWWGKRRIFFFYPANMICRVWYYIRRLMLDSIYTSILLYQGCDMGIYWCIDCFSIGWNHTSFFFFGERASRLRRPEYRIGFCHHMEKGSVGHSGWVCDFCLSHNSFCSTPPLFFVDIGKTLLLCSFPCIWCFSFFIFLFFGDARFFADEWYHGIIRILRMCYDNIQRQWLHSCIRSAFCIPSSSYSLYACFFWCAGIVIRGGREGRDTHKKYNKKRVHHYYVPYTYIRRVCTRSDGFGALSILLSSSLFLILSIFIL